MSKLENKSILKISILLISLFISCYYNQVKAQQFRSLYEMGNFDCKISIDSAYALTVSQYQKAQESADTISTINSLITLSAIHRSKLEFSNSFTCAGNALFLAEEFGNILYQAKALEEMGVLNYLFVRDEEAGVYFKKSANLYKKAYSLKMLEKPELFRAYYNLILYNYRKNNIEKGYNYIDSCIWVATDTNIVKNIYINEKKAIFYSKTKNYELASHFLNQSISLLENLDNKNELNEIHKSFYIVLYTSMGNIWKHTNNYPKAKEYYQKALSINDYLGEYIFYRSYIHSQFAELLFELGETKAAYQNLKKAKQINDKYLNPRNSNNQDFLTIKDKYTEELNRKNEEITIQKLELANSKQKLLQVRVILILIALALIVTIFVVRSRILSLKHQKAIAVSQQEQEHQKELIQHKNQELITTMLQLIEKEEIVNKLSKHIKENNNDSSSNSLLKRIDKQSVSLWEAFNTRFVEQDPDFYERLKTKAPNLTPSELKLCALIKLNFSGKEMAYLLGISEGSTNVARHRLRKKLGLERETNLTGFIASI